MVSFGRFDLASIANDTTAYYATFQLTLSAAAAALVLISSQKVDQTSVLMFSEKATVVEKAVNYVFRSRNVNAIS